MKKQHTQSGLSRKGFTLIELLVVFSIIGLLSSVVLAAVSSGRARGVVAAGQRFDQHTHSAYFTDLIASWNFDADGSNIVLDQSGNGNNIAYLATGSGSGTGPTGSPNPFSTGKSFLMVGGTAKTGTPVGSPATSITEVNLRNSPTGDFSISTWLYITTTSAGDFIYLYNPASPTTDKGWRLSYSAAGSGGLAFNYYSNGVKTALLGQVPLNTWHQVTATCNAGKIGMYLNGKQTGTTNTFGSTCGFLANRPVEMSGIQIYYVDNVRIYDRALPLAAIQDIYLAEAPEFKVATRHEEN